MKAAQMWMVQLEKLDAAGFASEPRDGVGRPGRVSSRRGIVSSSSEVDAIRANSPTKAQARKAFPD